MLLLLRNAKNILLVRTTQVHSPLPYFSKSSSRGIKQETLFRIAVAGSRRDQKIKRSRRGTEVELDFQVSPEEIMSREVELGCESWTSFSSSFSSTAVQRTVSL